jgi:hypothetical protein
MKWLIVVAVLTGLGFIDAHQTGTTIEQMPAKLETQFALSPLPPAMRDQATAYLLDPKKGYQLSRQGTSGVTCLVKRTAWAQADFRNERLCSSLLRRRGIKDLLEGYYGRGHASHVDIGAPPNPSLLYPSIFKEGIAEQSYMIQLV